MPSPAEESFYAYLMSPEAPQPWLSLAAAVNRPNWQHKGACGDADPEVFFPPRGASVLPAVAVCSNCAVQPECLRYALADTTLTGIWGGTSERGRRLMRRAARKPPAVAGGSIAS